MAISYAYTCYRIQRKRIKREVDGRCENMASAVKPQSPLTLQWENAATFRRVSEALNLPQTYVSALYHASGHVELSRIPRTPI
jgi:hypothetical protein